MRITNLKRLFFIVFISIGNTSFSQEQSLSYDLITVQELIEDVDVLKSNLETIHAGLYNHTSKEEMDAAFREIKDKINKPMSATEFYRIIACLHKYIKNGHTIIIPSEDFDNATANTTPIFPLDVYWDKNSLYVLRNNSDNISLPVGSRLDSINGYSAGELFTKMAGLWTRDGNNKTFPEGITQRAFSGFYINFIGNPEMYDIVYTKYDLGTSAKLNLKGLTNLVIAKNRKERYGDIHDYWQKRDGDAITLELKGNTALLKIKTCSNSDIRKFGRSIKGIMNRFFNRIIDNKVEHLIVDLRNNGGGDEIVSRELFRHISEKPFVLFGDSYLITNKIPNKGLYKENVGLINTFSKIGINRSKDGNFRLNAFGRLIYRSSTKFKEHNPYKKKYNGKIYTLTNAYTFSAAGEIASSMKTNTKSIFIGEEAGGNSTVLVAGEVFTLVLPNSKNRVRIPVVNQEVHTTVKQRDRGVIPDYQVRNNIHDMMEGKDAMLEFTYNLIKEKG